MKKNIIYLLTSVPSSATKHKGSELRQEDKVKITKSHQENNNIIFRLGNISVETAQPVWEN